MSSALQSGTAVIGADGTARITLGPNVYGTKWVIDRMTCFSTSTLATQLRVFLGFENGQLIDNTTLGNNAASEVNNLILNAGEVLVWVWSNGTPGAACTGMVFGEQRRR